MFSRVFLVPVFLIQQLNQKQINLKLRLALHYDLNQIRKLPSKS